MTIDKFISVSLQTANLAPERTDTGSGQVGGDMVLTARALSQVTSPYGTADNTFATADQVPSSRWSVTATARGATTITTIDKYGTSIVSGLLVTGVDALNNSIFASNTRVLELIDAYTFTIDTPTIQPITASTLITIAGDFRGIDGTQPVGQSLTAYAAGIIAAGSTILNVTNGFNQQNSLQIVGMMLLSPTGTFQAGTTVTQVINENQIEISLPTLASIADGTAITVASGSNTTYMDYRADVDPRFQYIRRTSPRSFGYIAGYLAGTTQAPNGEPTGAGISFPANPQTGDYFLRLDYLPQQLFRYDGTLWIKISEDVRTASGFGINDKSQLSTFINNTARTPTAGGTSVPQSQSLSQALRIQPD
jgi:hypothetical protein